MGDQADGTDRGEWWIASGLHLPLLLFLYSLVGCDHSPPASPASASSHQAARVLRVRVPGQVAELEGHAWPLLPDGRLSKLAAIDSPCRVCIDLAGGRSVRVEASTVMMTEEEGRLAAVVVQLAAQSASFEDAVKQMENVFGQLRGGGLRVDSACLVELRSTPLRSGLHEARTYRVAAEGSVTVYLTIKEDVDNGWYIVLRFHASDGTTDDKTAPH